MDGLKATVVLKDTVYKCSQCTRGFLSTRECNVHEQQHFKPILIKNIYCTKDIEKPLKCEYKLLNNIKIEYDEHFEDSNNDDSEVWNESQSKEYKYEDKSRIPKAKRKTISRNTQKLKQNKKHDEKITNTKKQKIKNENLNDVHVKKGPDGYECPLCPLKYSKYVNVAMHYKEHVKQMPYSCEVCSKGFLRKRDYAHHRHVHNKIRTPKLFKCPHCPKVFKQKFYLKPHIYTHTGEKPHTCKECGRAFTQQCGLVVHMKAHRNLKEHKCKICQKAFNNLSTLYVHQKIHTNNREYKCSFCPKDFNDNTARRRHERIHTGNMMYTCELCKKQFTDFSGYSAHKLRHDLNNRKHKCDKCSKVFFAKSNLRNHHKNMHEKLHACKFCTVKFNTRKDLNVHLVGVHGNVKLQCDICKWRTLTKSSLIKHIRIHYTRKKNENGKTVTMQKKVNYYY